MGVTKHFVQTVNTFFLQVFDIYEKEVSKKDINERICYNFYRRKFLFLFYEKKLIIKPIGGVKNKIQIIINPNPDINIDDYQTLKYDYQRLKNLILENPEEYAKKMIDEEYNNNCDKMSECYNKWVEEEYEKSSTWEYEEKEYCSNKYKEYLESINNVIKETCDNNQNEIYHIIEYLSFFSDIKTTEDLRNIRIVSKFYIPSMIDTFLDLLTTGNYDTVVLPLRQIFESFLRALYYDNCEEDNINIMEWFDTNNPGYNVGNAVIHNITRKETFIKFEEKYGRNVRTELKDFWKKLSTSVHKHELNEKFTIGYDYDKERFVENYKFFSNLIETLLITLVLNFPEMYNKIRYKRSFNITNLELFLLEHS